MRHRETVEIMIGACTLGVSLYLAFGPLRSRLPRVLTRFARLAAVLKLAALGIACAWWLRVNIRHDGPMAIRWVLVIVGLSLIAAAAFVATRPAAPAHRVESRQARRSRETQKDRLARKSRPRGLGIERT
jgi:hypothetical protein